MEEFRKLMNFLLLMLTALALKKKAGNDLSSFIPTMSARYASPSIYDLWGDPFISVRSSPMIKLSFRTKLAAVVEPPIVHGRCALADHNYTLLTTQSYNEWFAEQTGTSLLRFEPVVKQPHQGPVIIFHRRYRITALILSDLVADAFKATWNSPTCRALIDLIIRWGSTLAFWLTSIAGPENVYAFEQLRAAMLWRHGKRRHQPPAAPALAPVPLPLPHPSPSHGCTRSAPSQPPPRRVIPQAPIVETTELKSEFALDLERQLDRALRLEYAPPSLADVVPGRVAPPEESMVALEYVSLLEDDVQERAPARDAAEGMRDRVRGYPPSASNEEPEAMVVAKRDEVRLPILRAIKRPRRSIEELLGQVTTAPRELSEEDKEAQTEERRRKAIVVRTFLHTSVPRMAPRFPPMSLSTPYLDAVEAEVDAGGMSAFALTARSADVAPPILLKRGRKRLLILRIAGPADPEHRRGVRREMEALRLLADCAWAARLVCYYSRSTYVEIQLRYYSTKRSFRSMMTNNGGFLSFRVAVFYLAELIVAIQAFQSYGLIHTDIRIDDLTLSPRGDIIVQNFDHSEIFNEGRLPYWIPRHENFFKREPVGYDDYVRAAYLYHEMLTGVVLEGGAGPRSRHHKRQANRKQEPRAIDFDFIHFVTGTYPILARDASSIVEHALFKDINWRAVKDQTAAVPVCNKTLRALAGD